MGVRRSRNRLLIQLKDDTIGLSQALLASVEYKVLRRAEAMV